MMFSGAQPNLQNEFTSAVNGIPGMKQGGITDAQRMMLMQMGFGLIGQQPGFNFLSGGMPQSQMRQMQRPGGRDMSPRIGR